MSGFVEKFFFEENGWTSGQYAVFRILLGVHLLCALAFELFSALHTGVWFWVPFDLLGILAALGFIRGKFDRISALILAGLWGRFGVFPAAPHNSEPLLIYILLAHWELPPVPMGLYEPAEEERGKWRLPQPVHALIWFIVMFFYFCVGAGVWLGFDYPTLTRLLVVSPFAIVRRYRPWVWLVQMFIVIYLLIALGDIVMPLVLVQFYLFDPAWIAPVGSGTTETIFYDGECGLCHRFVLFVLREDRLERRFNFAPLGNKSFLEQIAESERVGLPDSIVVRCSDGRILTKSRAAFHVLRGLGGVWRILAAVFAVIPRLIADAAYDAVARARKRFFKQPDTACPVMPAAWQGRMLSE